MTNFINLAYGSNLHPVRLAERCPSARLVGTGLLPGWRLAFQKRSTDRSGKCDAIRTGNPGEGIWVAVYEIPEDEKAALDAAEGLGKGYHEEEIEIEVSGAKIRGSLYVADQAAIDPKLRPYDWYKAMVLLGAEYHSFPVDYIGGIRTVQAIPDTNGHRSEEGWRIVRALETANQALQRIASSAGALPATR